MPCHPMPRHVLPVPRHSVPTREGLAARSALSPPRCSARGDGLQASAVATTRVYGAAAHA
jgi:hypothetical protein